jgi:hypothetical protein
LYLPNFSQVFMNPSQTLVSFDLLRFYQFRVWKPPMYIILHVGSPPWRLTRSWRWPCKALCARKL